MRSLLILVVLLAIAACDENQNTGVTFDKEIKLDNGLTVARPKGFTEGLEADRIVLTETGDLRSPRIISVSLSETAPLLDDPDTRDVKGEKVRYKVGEEGSGSGGTEYQLQAVRAVGPKFLVLTAFVQVEGRTPDFATAWAVMERARVE